MTRRKVGVRCALALTLALACATPASSQVIKQDRRDYAFVCTLRRELFPLLRTCERDVRADVTRILAERSEGDPLALLARARARLIGGEPGSELDEDARFRHALQLYAMPEVVDPDEFSHLAVTVRLTTRRAKSATARFVVELVDGDDRVLGTPHEIPAERSGIDDLLAYAAHVPIPLGTDLPTGKRLLARLSTRIGDAVAPADERAVQVGFVIVPRFKARADALFADLAKVGSDVDPIHQASAVGLVAAVDRVYRGEPEFGIPFRLADLERAEAAVATLRDGGDPLDRPFAGEWVSIAFPASTHPPLLARVRVPERAADQKRRPPLLLFVPGVPMLDAHFARPSSPPSTPPDDLACLLQATSLAADPEACIVVVESPGRVPELHALLTPLCTSLAARYRLGDWFWIGEREGAAMLANELGRRPPQLSGVVLILGGGLAPDAVAALGAFPVLGIAAPEHPSAENLSRIGAAAKARAATGVTVESVEGLPWPLAVPLSVDRIEQFVARHRTAAPR